MTKCRAPPCSGSTFCLTFCSLSSQPRDGQFEPVEWECWLIHKCVFTGIRVTSKCQALAQNLLELYLSSSLGHLRSLSCLRYCKAKWNVKQFQPKWPSSLAISLLRELLVVCGVVTAMVNARVATNVTMQQKLGTPRMRLQTFGARNIIHTARVQTAWPVVENLQQALGIVRHHGTASNMAMFATN